MSGCDFNLSLRVVAADGTTVRGDLNDQANGLTLMAPLVLPQDEVSRARYRSPRAKGDFTSGPPLDDPSELVATVEVTGATWAQVETRWDTVRGWVKAEWDFFIEYEVEGVTTRWRTERPNIAVAEQTSSDYRSLALTYQLRFITQPNPVVTIA